MPLGMIDRKLSQPPGFLENACVQVSYRLPGLRHCYVLCHDAATATPGTTDAALLALFIRQAERLAMDAVGDPQAFMTIFSGASMRRRPSLHMHVFVVQRRWQKAWVYLILGMKNLALSAWLAGRRLAGRT